MAEHADPAFRSSYQQYKLDTSAFLTWLLKTAQACGYRYVANGEPTPLKKSLTAPVSVAGSKIPVREIIVQARLVCSTRLPVSRLPRGVEKIGRRAICLRQKFPARARLAGSASADVLESDEQHEFFTNTLEQAIELLSEHSINLPSNDKSRSIQAAGHDATNKEDHQLSNHFSGPKVEDCDDAEEVLTQLRQRTGATSTSQAAKHGKIATWDEEAKHRPDEVDSEDMWMRVNCFFDDLHELRAEVLKIWKDYKRGQIDCMAASMTTNAAIILAEQMEDELWLRLPQSVHTDTSDLDPTFFSTASRYAVITGLAMRSMAEDKAGIFRHDPSIAFTEMGAQCFYGIATIMTKYMFGVRMMAAHAKSLLVHKQKATALDAAFRNDPRLARRTPTLQTFFLAFSAQENEFETNKELQRLQSMDNYLTPLFLDIAARVAQVVGSKLSNPRSAVFDLPSHHADMMLEGVLSTTAVFSWALMWDLRALLDGQETRIYKALRQEALRSWESIKYVFPDQECAKGPFWTPADSVHLNFLRLCRDMVFDDDKLWHKYQLDVIKRSQDASERICDQDYEDFSTCIAQTRLSREEQKMRLDRIRAMERTYVCPHVDSERYFYDNPLACGTMMFNISLAREQAGVSLANFDMTIVWVAYIYTAFKTDGMLRIQWRDMDNLIAANLKNIFFGAIPETHKRLRSSLLLRMGLGIKPSANASTTFNCTGGDRTGQLPVKQARCSCFSISTTPIAIDAWFSSKDNPLRSLYAIEAIMRKTEPKGPRRSQVQPTIRPIEFLQQFRQHMAAECARHEINYIELSRTCHVLLHDMIKTKEYKRIAYSMDAFDSIHDLKPPKDLELFGGREHDYFWKVPYMITLAEEFASSIYHSRQSKDMRRDGYQGASISLPLGRWFAKYLREQGHLETEKTKSSRQAVPLSSESQTTAKKSASMISCVEGSMVVEVVDDQFLGSKHGVGQLIHFWARLYNDTR